MKEKWSVDEFLGDVVNKFDCKIEVRFVDGSRVELIVMHCVIPSPWPGTATRTLFSVAAEAPEGKSKEFLKTYGISPLDYVSGE